MPSEYTRSGVRRAGDDYQDIVALDLLVEMLEHPGRYEWARVEADDAGFLDDVVALRGAGVIVARQVKFSAHPDDAADPYTWDDFVKERTSEKGNTLLSLLSKWGKSFRELKGAYAGVEATLVSNRRPADDLQNSFAAPGVVDLERITDITVRNSVVAQLGGEENAREFFANFRFQLDLPSLHILEEGILRRFTRLGGDLGAWKNLKDELRKWVRERSSPPPDGRITLGAVKGAARWQQLEALPEAFVLPADFVIPDDRFHENLLRLLRTTASGCVVVTGPPGIGKSTYISNLYRELREAETPVIRHHFFLSRDDPTPFRYNHLKVASSLMSELQALSARLGLEVRRGNPTPEELPGWLSDIGRQLTDRDSRLVVILDGLDEVWRDTQSIDELNKLFQLLTPIPRGVILLVGTQPVDASRLPRRLSEIAPKETWLDLPALEYTAVRRWAEFHASDLRALRDGEVDSHRLDELAGALWKRSEGHPLHLGYLLKSLQEVKGYIIARDIERLPDAPHRDISRYYAGFWEDLPDDSKQVLCLLATCDFPWSRMNIAACLDPASQNLAIDAAIRRVTHLTAEGPLGLQFAHTSLQFFVRQHADYKNYAARIRGMALEWLRTRAPDFFRWSYEWLLAAEDGDEEPLLRGPNRSWLIEGMARRYPTHIADRILTRCAWVALQRGELERFVEVALLSDYLSDAVDSRDYVLQSLLPSQLAIREGETIVDRSRTEMNTLGNLELLGLAEYCQTNGMSDVIKECFDRLNARIKAGHAGPDTYPRMDAGRCLARVAAFAPNVNPPSVLDWLSRQERTKFARALWEDYTDSLRAHRQADRLRIAIEGSDDLPAERARALSCLVLLACEDGIDPGTSGPPGESLDPFVVVARALRGDVSDPGLPVQAPEPWVLRMSDYEFYQHYDEIAEYFWRMFFVFTSNCLLGREDDNLRLTEPFADKGWIRSFVDASAAAASSFARRLRLKQVTTYSWIFTQFSEIRQPDYVLDRAGHEFAIAVRKAIFRLAMDLQAVQACMHSPAIDGQEIEAARRMPLFRLHIWMEMTVAYRRTWFTAAGLMTTLSMIESELASTVEDFGSRAELCALAAELATSHASLGAAAKWVHECWSNLLAYGFHKDMLLDQCLDAAEHLQKAGCNSEALDLLLRLAPAISVVGDYTDGDETNHLPAELGRLLFNGDLRHFVKYHEWLCERGEYWDASSTFKTLTAKADLGNRMFRAVAETAVERENLLALADRSDGGDLNATECLRSLSLYQVPAHRVSESDSSAATQRLLGSEPTPDVGDFPPERFEAYLGAVQTAGSYRVDEDVDAWATFWSAQGHKKPVLEALEAYDIDRSLSYGDPRLRFELTMHVRGKQAAYQVLLAAQQRGYGWNRYFSRPELVRYVWAKLRELYPEKWLDFLQSTLMSDPRHLSRSGVTAQHHISRLVEFLLVMEQPEVAMRLASAATDTTLQLVPLDLPSLTWTSEAPVTKIEASALDLLFQRLTWPSGLVRERACVSLGSLLADVNLGPEVTSAVLGWMAAQKLESVVVFGLLALFHAKTRGAAIPAWSVVSQHLSTPSLLSWLIARELYAQHIGDPSVGDLHSETAPAGFEADPFFLQYAENFVPPVYLMRATDIDQKKCSGFLAQWAFEWTTVVAVAGLKLRGPYVSFWTRQDDDHLSCLDLPLSEAYRSAFLRALAWAADVRGMRPGDSLWLAAQTCPIDLGLWVTSPGNRPESWPECPPSGNSVDAIPGCISIALASMWKRQLGEDWAIAEAGGRVQESDNSAYDLRIIGVIQACTGPATPDIDALCTVRTRRMIGWEAEYLLAFGGSYGREPADDWQERHSDWLIWRLATQFDPNTVPRWQWWRLRRGVWLPLPFLAEKAFQFRCTQDAVIVHEDGHDVARWIDWTDKLREMTTANLSPSTGQMLLIRRSVIEREAAKLGGVFAWICKITTYHRKYSYSPFTKAHFVLDFGTTRIVQKGN